VTATVSSCFNTSDRNSTTPFPPFDEGVADAFLATTPGFAPLHAAQASSRLAATLVDRRGHLRTQPDLHGLEAFFGAVFERRQA